MGTNVRPQFVESSAGKHIPLLDKAVAGTDLLSISELVSAEENSYSLALRQIPYQAVYALRALRIEAGSRFVQKQYFGLCMRALASRQPLSHTCRI